MAPRKAEIDQRSNINVSILRLGCAPRGTGRIRTWKGRSALKTDIDTIACGPRRALRVALLASCAGMTMLTLATPARAQDEAGQQASQDQAIVITGSRIVRRDYEANSPIVTVGSELLENSATGAIEQSLNKLPQFTPTLKNPTQGGDIQPTAQNTPGAATISLRGIGSNRNIVLVDGRRATPSNATMVVDINTIPSAAIDRVEIISGGASSTYGADAVGGVVNFIMKKNFQGLELDAQTAITQRGDNFEYQVSGIMGANFDDGRGNISLSFSMNERQDARQSNRRWYRDLWENPTITGTQFFPDRPGFNIGFDPEQAIPNAVLNSVMGVTGWTNNGVGSIIYTNPDGSAFAGFDTAGIAGVPANKVVDGLTYKKLSNGTLGKNFTDNYLIFPLERFNIYTRGNYEINDWIGVFAQGIFSKVKTTTVQEPSPLTGGWGVLVPYNSAAPQAGIPDSIVTLLNARANPNAPIDLRGLLPFNRGSETEVYTYNMIAGIEGRIPGSDWTFEIYGSHGESETSVLQTGFASLQRFRAVMSAPDFGRGFRSQGNAAFGGFGAATATCTSGLNPFMDPALISQDCIDAIKADIKTKAVMQQTVWEANFQGGLFNLPAGQVRAAVGATYRHNDYKFQNDTLTTQGTSFQEQALGLYPSGNSQGRIVAKEIYGELLIPLLSDLPLIRKLDLEVGARSSDYNTTGNSFTWKIQGDWQVTEWLRFRGGYNKAERAPNIAELYLAPEQTFAIAEGGDVCSLNSGLGWSANPARNSNWANVVGLCGQIMEASGDATADQQYWGVDYRTLAAAGSEAAARALVTMPQAAGQAFVFPTLAGNNSLRPEKADTWTAGMVIQSPFESAMLRRLRLTVDYYNIKVTDAIGAQTVDIAQRQCFDSAFNGSYDPSSPFCLGIDRNQTGALGNVVRTFFNNGRFQTSGIDAQLDWAFDLGPGTVNFNSIFNYLIEMKSAELDVLPLTEFAGTLGGTQNGLNGGMFRWKLLTTLGYTYGPVYLGLQWRHLPSVKSATAAQVPNTSVAGAPAYDLFNLQGSFAITRDATLRFGVDNLFDKAPPMINVDTAAVPPTLANGAYDSNNYDVIGRRFYIGAKFRF
ncbi:TonB-dependent receptor plug domain-containing protein [Sphingobium lignivorans]|uniref:Outer membrane receptor protein involved in Fe transport n=1 Tax=Sphingobium lignivorans TaxID=2735886 RepID=A0ABR6NK36_9SPHN|nr:TonB-dependent receptor [Sphingobium lignivorans]MBB5987628.1 outer membrane receptor protein involved in Fe transport [Sphingobium lignivorans]